MTWCCRQLTEYTMCIDLFCIISVREDILRRSKSEDASLEKEWLIWLELEGMGGARSTEEGGNWADSTLSLGHSLEPLLCMPRVPLECIDWVLMCLQLTDFLAEGGMGFHFRWCRVDKMKTAHLQQAKETIRVKRSVSFCLHFNDHCQLAGNPRDVSASSPSSRELCGSLFSDSLVTAVFPVGANVVHSQVSLLWTRHWLVLLGMKKTRHPVKERGRRHGLMCTWCVVWGEEMGRLLWAAKILNDKKIVTISENFWFPKTFHLTLRPTVKEKVGKFSRGNLTSRADRYIFQGHATCKWWSR